MKTVVRRLRCKKCKGENWKFRWEYKEKEETALYICHDGWGFQLTDSIITCGTCGVESEYEMEDFLECWKVQTPEQEAIAEAKRLKAEKERKESFEKAWKLIKPMLDAHYEKSKEAIK